MPSVHRQQMHIPKRDSDIKVGFTRIVDLFGQRGSANVKCGQNSYKLTFNAKMISCIAQALHVNFHPNTLGHGIFFSIASLMPSFRGPESSTTSVSMLRNSYRK